MQFAASKPTHIHFRREKNNRRVVHSGGEPNPKEKTWDVTDTSVNKLNEIDST